MLRDFHIAAPNLRDQDRLEILADGLSLYGGAQLAVDTMFVSLLHCYGSPAHHRRERIQNSSVLTEERGWWSWLGRGEEADGLRRPGVSFPASPKLKQGRNHEICGASLAGAVVRSLGVHCSSSLRCFLAGVATRPVVLVGSSHATRR